MARVARQLVSENGLEDVVTVIQSEVEKVELPGCQPGNFTSDFYN